MLELDSINLSYADQQIIFDLSLSLAAGQFGCLLGPSGCGKTSVLRAIAGFETIHAGSIYLHDSCVSTNKILVPPEKRNIGVVFQDFALFPHLTVAENVAFGLQLSASRKQAKIDEMLQLVGLEGLQGRYPHQLSGGQQQRVALARALAPSPDLLLLDEPFSSLDEELREAMAKDLANIVKQQGTTTLMVTHDQHEAFALADSIAVINQGKLQQLGSAYELYHQPGNIFVADFIGDGVFIPGHLSHNKLNTLLGEFEVEKHSSETSQPVQLLVRPDDIVHDDSSAFKAQIISRAFQGAHIMYELSLLGEQNYPLLCLTPSHHDHKVGERFGIRLDLAHLVYFPSDN